MCLTADLSAESLQARREWQDIFKVLKGKNLQPRLLYLERILFKINGEIKSFSDKQKLKEFRIIAVKMIKNLENKMEKMQDSVSKDLEELKTKHTNNTITEIKNTLEGVNRISEAEEQISELEDKMVEITSEEENKVKK